MKHFTWQDFQQAENPMEALRAAIRDYRCSAAFRNALEADAYFSGRNTEVARKTILRARKLETVDASGRRRVRCEMNDVAGNRISSGFLFRFIWPSVYLAVFCFSKYRKYVMASKSAEPPGERFLWMKSSSIFCSTVSSGKGFLCSRMAVSRAMRCWVS